MAALAIVGAAGVSVVGSYLSGRAQSSSLKKAARIQARENARIEKLKIRFTRGESQREMLRFGESQKEDRRQFNLGFSQRQKESELQESQFARSFGLQKEDFKLKKDQTIFQNRMALQENFRNILSEDHNLRMNLMDRKLNLVKGRR